MKGIIKKIDERGFCFITVVGQKDIFAHANDFSNADFKEMREGDAVTFETAESEKGPKAIKVTRDMGGAAEAPAMDDEEDMEEAA